jgi:hypothetical protein
LVASDTSSGDRQNKAVTLCAANIRKGTPSLPSLSIFHHFYLHHSLCGWSNFAHKASTQRARILPFDLRKALPREKTAH